MPPGNTTGVIFHFLEGGIGKPKVGSAAEQRGECAHLFDSELIRASVHAEYPGSLEWPRHGHDVVALAS